MRFQQAAARDLGLRHPAGRQLDYDQDGERPCDRADWRRRCRRSSQSAKQERGSAHFRSVVAAAQVRQLLVEAAQTSPHLGRALGQGLTANVEVLGRRRVIVAFDLAIVPDQAAQRTIGRFQPGNCLGQQKAVRLQVGILP